MAPVIINPGGAGDRRAIVLMTRTRREIPNEQSLRRPPASMNAALGFVRNQFSEAMVELRALDSLYNCVGLVFAGRRTSVEPEHVEAMLLDDGYEKRPSIELARVGDVAVYRAGGELTHVGLVAEARVDLAGGGATRVRILSQWGFDGEYLHDADAVPPVYGRLAEVWTYRYGAPR